VNKNLLLLSSALSFVSVPAFAAQDTASDTAADADGNAADIVVTAQKREQRITDVPISISAYNGAFLEQIGGTELNKVSAITPGFVIQLQDKFAPGFSVRGITSNDFSPQSEQRVAVFQDGVAVTQTASAYGELFDIDRIEVEKGPQSTLHGRSALNGGVSIFQKRPTDDFSVEVKGGIGNYDYFSAQGVVNLPIGDTLGIRFGALKRKRDGFVKDSDGSGTYNAVNAEAYRFAGKWEPSEAFSFNLIATYDVDHTKGGVPFKSRTFLPLDQKTGAVAGDMKFWTPTHLDTFGTLPDPYFKRKILGISGTADWRLNDKLSLTSITGYRWYDACQSGDNDGTPTNLIAYHQCNDGKQISEELRLNFSDLGIFEGFVGGSVFHASNGMSMEMGYDERAMALLLSGTLQQFAPKGLTNAQINALLGPAADTFKAFHLDRQLTGAKITTFDYRQRRDRSGRQQPADGVGQVHQPARPDFHGAVRPRTCAGFPRGRQPLRQQGLSDPFGLSGAWADRQGRRGQAAIWRRDWRWLAAADDVRHGARHAFGADSHLFQPLQAAQQRNAAIRFVVQGGGKAAPERRGLSQGRRVQDRSHRFPRPFRQDGTRGESGAINPTA